MSGSARCSMLPNVNDWVPCAGRSIATASPLAVHWYGWHSLRIFLNLLHVLLFLVPVLIVECPMVSLTLRMGTGSPSNSPFHTLPTGSWPPLPLGLLSELMLNELIPICPLVS